MILRLLNIRISILFRYEKLENCALEIHAFCVFVIENAKYIFDLRHFCVQLSNDI